MKKFNFVYITTNLINGKQYIGDHSTDNINDIYFGSGLYIINALNEYKIKNFKRDILEFFPTKQEAFDAQEKYIKEYNTLVSNGYNISPKGGHQVTGGISKETCKKISENVKKVFKNNPEILKKCGNSTREKKLPKETCKKISKSLIDRITSPEHSKHLSEALKNRKFSEETIKKMSAAKKGKSSNRKGKKQPLHLCCYCNREIGAGNYERWHGEKCKLNNIAVLSKL